MSRAEDIFQKLVYFGEDAIDEYIVNMQTEELFLDFKQAISIGKTVPPCIRTTVKIWPNAFPGSAIRKAAWLFGGLNVQGIWKSAMWPKPRLRSKTFIAF